MESILRLNYFMHFNKYFIQEYTKNLETVIRDQLYIVFNMNKIFIREFH